MLSRAFVPSRALAAHSLRAFAARMSSLPPAAPGGESSPGNSAKPSEAGDEESAAQTLWDSLSETDRAILAARAASAGGSSDAEAAVDELRAQFAAEQAEARREAEETASTVSTPAEGRKNGLFRPVPPRPGLTR